MKWCHPVLFAPPPISDADPPRAWGTRGDELLVAPVVRIGLGLFDVCPTRDEGGGRAAACGQTLNKPPGTKPRNAEARFEWGPAYGDLSSATVPEMAGDGRIEASATHRSAPTAIIGARNPPVWGGERWRYGIRQQPAAPSAGNSGADAGLRRENCRLPIMAVHGSAVAGS